MTPKIVKEKTIPVEKLGRKLESEPDLEFTKKIYAQYPDAEIYVVGGTVRDCMMGREDSKDYDLVVRNVPAKDLANALGKLGQVDLVGARFGVFKFVPHPVRSKSPKATTDAQAHRTSNGTQAIDIALPRRDIAYGTGGYRDFETQSDPKLPIEQDLSRRDFTWNAMAWELKEGKLVDPFGGIFDIEARVVRAVGKPEERFKEDYSRMLRAARFAARFGFTIEGETLQTIKNLSRHINDEREGKDGNLERVVPYEMISREFLKALYADPVRAIELYEETDMLYKIIPEFEASRDCEQPPEWHSEGDVWTHTKMALGNLRSKAFRDFFGGKQASPETVFAALLHDVGKPGTKKTPEKDGVDRIRFDGHDSYGAEIARKICERLRVNSVEDLDVDTERIIWLVRYHLFTLNTDLDKVKKTTLERYFFRDERLGEELLHLTFADASASIPKGGVPDLSNLEKLMKLLDEMRTLRKEKPALPKPLLNGDEIMKILHLQPGPEVGKVILELREAQLSGKIVTKEEATNFIKNNIA